MQRTKVEWTERSWNPITGCYGPGGTEKQPLRCSYCYAYAIANRFKGTKAWPNGFTPTFHKNRLNEAYALKKPSKIFVCSAGELFAPWVPRSWMEDIFQVFKNCPQHTFQVLTKQPHCIPIRDFEYPPNLWVGVSITRNSDLWRAQVLLDNCPAKVRFISFEPLLQDIQIFSLDPLGIDWIIVGALTGTKSFVPPDSWVENIMGYAYDHGIPVFLKDNLKRKDIIRHFPLEANDVQDS